MFSCCVVVIKLVVGDCLLLFNCVHCVLLASKMSETEDLILLVNCFPFHGHHVLVVEYGVVGIWGILSLASFIPNLFCCSVLD